MRRNLHGYVKSASYDPKIINIFNSTRSAQAKSEGRIVWVEYPWLDPNITMQIRVFGTGWNKESSCTGIIGYV
jgi:hypothetical protein